MSSTIATLATAQNQITRYSGYIVIVGGTIGNAFILILFRKRWRNSCALYLFCAAVFNILNILVNVPIRVYGTYYPDPYNYSIHLCRLKFYSGHAWSQIGRYLLASACVDRYIATAHEVHYRVIRRPAVARCFAGVMITFWHVASIHLLVLTTIKNGQCGQFDLYAFVYFIYAVIFLFFVPTFLMLVFGYLAFRNMQQLHTRIRPMEVVTAVTETRRKILRRDRDLLTLVFIEGIVYVATNMPYPIVYLEIGVTNYMGTSKSPLYVQIESLCSSIGSSFIYFNNAVPFYTYIATSKVFRKDLKKLLTGWKQRFI